MLSDQVSGLIIIDLIKITTRLKYMIKTFVSLIKARHGEKVT